MRVKKTHYPKYDGNPDKLPKVIRLQMAYDYYLDQNKKKSIYQVIRKYRVRWEYFEIELRELYQRQRL
jgi:hypothetical protein